MEQENIDKVLNMKELIALINNTKGDFLISIQLGEEADTNAEEE